MQRLHDVIAEHRSYVRGSLVRLGVSGSALDDAEQEVFLVLVRRAADFDPGIGASYRRWLWGISKNVAAALRRGAKRARSCTTELVDIGVRPPIEDRVAAREVLAWLDEGVREVWVAKGEGFTAGEIATAMRVPVTTVQWRLRVAQRRVDAWVAAAGRRCRAVLFGLPRVARTFATSAASSWAAVAFLLLATEAAADDVREDRSSTANDVADLDARGPMRAMSRDLDVLTVRPCCAKTSGELPAPRGIVMDQPPRVDPEAPHALEASRRGQLRRKGPRGRVELLEPIVAPAMSGPPPHHTRPDVE